MSIYGSGEMEKRRRKAVERQKTPPTGSAESLAYCAEQAMSSGQVQPVNFARQFEYIRTQAVSDDPIVWLVEEFGALHRIGSSSRSLFAWVPMPNEPDNWLVEYHSNHGEWLVFDQYTSHPLTRDDVRRLCELFGVEVKR